MAHAGRPGAPQSPGPFRGRRDRPGAPPGGHLPYEEEEEWETDPDFIHKAGRPWGEREISTSSIISDLSRSIRDLSLGTSSPTGGTQDGADPRSPRGVYRGPAGGPQPPRCPHVRSSPSLGIERSSLFHRNAAEKLDTFFSEKLKAWASDSAHLSDTEGAQEEPPSSHAAWRAAQNGPAGRHQGTGGHRPRRAAHGDPAREQADGSRGRDEDPGGKRWLRCPGHRAAGKGQASDGLSRQQEGSRLSTSASSSARILPQCRISHVQRCRACQAFNQDKPAGRGGTWAPLPEEEGGSTSLSPPKGRARPPGQPQVPERIAKVQRWLEQTPLDHPAAPHRWHEKHRTPNRAEPGARGQRPVHGCPAQRSGEMRGRAPEAAGDHQSRGVPAEARRPRKSHHQESPKHPPAARLLPCCDDASTSPATCSCPFCERQRPRAQLLSGKDGPDLSAEQVAARLQAENRVPRIVEAFERRSLREAKRAEREMALRDALPQEPERKRRAPTGPGEPKRGGPAGGPPKAQAPPEKKPEEKPPRRRKEAETVGKQPSFLDRLRRRS